MVQRHKDLMTRYIDYGKRGDIKNREGVMREYLRVAKAGGMKVSDELLK